MTIIPASTETIPAQHDSPTSLTADVIDLPTGRAVIAMPVGAIVTNAGHVFAVEPLDAAALPVRVRCQQCPWQTTTHGLADATTQASRHATAHLGDPR